MNHGSHWDIGVEENAEFYGSQISRPSKLPQVGDNFGRHILGVMNSLMQVSHIGILFMWSFKQRKSWAV